MINVRYDGRYAIDIRGHAGQAVCGHDLVCAGASVLIYALAEYLNSNAQKCKKLDVSLKSGQGRIIAIPFEEHASEVLSAFETAVHGYMHLAQGYPDYIRLSDCIYKDSPT